MLTAHPLLFHPQGETGSPGKPGIPGSDGPYGPKVSKLGILQVRGFQKALQMLQIHLCNVLIPFKGHKWGYSGSVPINQHGSE